MGSLNNRAHLKELRRSLRARMSSSEAALWNALREPEFTQWKFRRQHSIGEYILDFYCPQQRLVIELDGAVHQNPTKSANDQERDALLNSYHIRVLRFRNDQILHALPSVLTEIREALGSARS